MNPLSTPHDTPHDARAARLRRWPETGYPAMLTATAAWHVLVLAAWLVAPRAWPWWLAAIFANHAVFTVAGLLPRTSLLGPNWTRLPAGARNADAIALTIDDGPDPVVTPQVLDLLDALGVHATFFCIGEKARRYPQLAREIVARGHALENHSQVHVHTFSVTLPGALCTATAVSSASGVGRRTSRLSASVTNTVVVPFTVLALRRPCASNA